jgi:hypothetical protein
MQSDNKTSKFDVPISNLFQRRACQSRLALRGMELMRSSKFLRRCLRISIRESSSFSFEWCIWTLAAQASGLPSILPPIQSGISRICRVPKPQ